MKEGGEIIRNIGGYAWEEKPGSQANASYFFWKCVKQLIKGSNTTEAVKQLKMLANYYGSTNSLLHVMKRGEHQELKDALDKNRDAIAQHLEFVQSPLAFTEGFLEIIHKYRGKDLEEIELSDEGIRELRDAFDKGRGNFAEICKRYGLSQKEGTQRAMFDYDGR